MSEKSCLTWLAIHLKEEKFDLKRCMHEIFVKQKDNGKHGLVGRVYTKGLGDQGSIPGQVIPKT